MKKGFRMVLTSSLVWIVLLLTNVSVAYDQVFVPMDESPHPYSSMGWWYVVGHMKGVDPDGVEHEYSFYFGGSRLQWPGEVPDNAMYYGLVSITDLNRGVLAKDMFPWSLQPEVVPPFGGYDLPLGDNMTIKGILGFNHVKADFSDGSYSIDIVTSPKNIFRPVVKHGDGGLIPYGPFGESYHYSEPNLRAGGVIVDHGVPIVVTGISWMDRQWGDFLPGPGGWVWFCIQLDNGTQYMLYFMTDLTGAVVQKVGTFIKRNGKGVDIDPDSMVMTPLDSWTSPVYGITYPQNWILEVPGGQLEVIVKQEDQELFGYWEGSASVTGTVDDEAVSGDSYIEVIPYAILPTPGNIPGM
jgi:predicted secreted hydrolase